MINALKKMVPERLSLRERAFQRHSDDLFISCKGNLLESFDETTGVRTLVERDDLKVPVNYHDYDIEVLLKTNPKLLQPNQALLQRNCMSMFDRLAYEIDSFEAYQASVVALKQRDVDLQSDLNKVLSKQRDADLQSESIKVVPQNGTSVETPKSE